MTQGLFELMADEMTPLISPLRDEMNNTEYQYVRLDIKKELYPERQCTIQKEKLLYTEYTVGMSQFDKVLSGSNHH